MRHLRSTTARFCAASVALAASALLAACSSAPPVRFHSLMPVDAPAPAASGTARAALAVIVEPVRIPPQVDLPQWVVRMADDSVARLEQERWASPLRDEIRLAIREWLIDRYGMVDTPIGTSAPAPVRIAIDVRRFESAPGREARAEGTWTLSRPNAASPSSEAGPTVSVVSCNWLLRERAGNDYPSVASAQRRLVERLTDSLASGVIALDRGVPVTCPIRDAA